VPLSDHYDKGTQVSKTVVFDTGLECLTKATELLLIGFLRSSWVADAHKK
jgi:hypothetical protein